MSKAKKHSAGIKILIAFAATIGVFILSNGIIAAVHVVASRYDATDAGRGGSSAMTSSLTWDGAEVPSVAGRSWKTMLGSTVEGNRNAKIHSDRALHDRLEN